MLVLTLCGLLFGQDGGTGGAAPPLPGTWLQVPSKSELMTLKPDGTADMMGHILIWAATDRVLRMTDNHGHTDPVPYVLQGDQLDLTYNGQIVTLVRKGSALEASVGEPSSSLRKGKTNQEKKRAESAVPTNVGEEACSKTLERAGGDGFKVSRRDVGASRVFGVEFGRASIGLIRFTKDPTKPADTSWKPERDGSLEGETRNLRGWRIFMSLSPQTKGRTKDFKRGAEQCLRTHGPLGLSLDR